MQIPRPMIATVILAVFSPSAHAAVPAVSLIDAGRLLDRTRVVGFEVQVNQPITITDLGKFDANQNGRLDDVMSPLVGIWQADSRELIVTSTIDLSSTAEFGAFYSPIEPVTLQPGNYVFGTQMFAEQEPYAYLGLMDTVSAVDWIRGCYVTGDTFAFPETNSSRVAYFGPAFQVEQPTALTSPRDGRVFQRNSNDTGRVPIAGYVSGNVETLEAGAMVMDGYSGTNTDWQPIDFQGNVFQGVLDVPAGGWYRLETRTFQEGQWQNGDSIEGIGVGEVFVTAGQSNSANFGSPRLTPNSDRVVAMTEQAGWQPAADPQPWANGTTGSPWPVLGDLLVERLQVPIGLVSVGWGGTAVGEWLPGATGLGHRALYDRLQKALTMLGPNGARTVLWHQGESDAWAETSTEEYRSRLETVISESRQDAGYDIPWGIALASFAQPWTTVENEVPIVEGQLAMLRDDALTFRGPLTDDMVGSTWRWDGIHFNEAGLREHARRWADAISLLLNPDAARGDFDANGTVDARDIDSITRQIRAGLREPHFDLDANGKLDSTDQAIWVREIKNTYFGDANLDGEFNTGDLVDVLTAGKYETKAYAGWFEGDWNGDGVFDTGDLVKALEDGGYEKGSRTDMPAVPEPSSWLLIVLGVPFVLVRPRKSAEH